MITSIFPFLILTALNIGITTAIDTEASVNVVTAGPCSDEYLRMKGVDPRTFTQKIDFDTSQMKLIPAKPKVPGCIRIVASNVTIKEKITQVTADFELRISNSPNPNVAPLKCKQDPNKVCGCGSSKYSCSYCDMCQNIHKSIKSASITANNHETAISTFSKNGCNCNVPPAFYDIDIEICTPEREEFKHDLPDELLNYMNDGTPFSLFTTMLMYNFRFNVQNDHLSPAAVKAMEAKKARGLIGCYILGSNIEINADFSSSG